MTGFKNCEEFYENLIAAINSGKDVYVFNYVCDTEHDFWYDDEDEKCFNFYVHWLFDITKLQRIIINDYDDVINEDIYENMKTSLDYYNEDDVMIGRLFIFQCK